MNDKPMFRALVRYLSCVCSRRFTAHFLVRFPPEDHKLAERYDKGLAAAMQKVDAARNNLRDAYAELQTYIDSRQDNV